MSVITLLLTRFNNFYSIVIDTLCVSAFFISENNSI